jgi:hypothetical protein
MSAWSPSMMPASMQRRTQQVRARVIGLPQRRESGPEEPEALEEDLPDQAGRVAEELVDGGR